MDVLLLLYSTRLTYPFLIVEIWLSFLVRFQFVIFIPHVHPFVLKVELKSELASEQNFHYTHLHNLFQTRSLRRVEDQKLSQKILTVRGYVEGDSILST